MHQIKTICVCGAGTMGSGIAQLCAASGYDTLLFDLNHDALVKSGQAITERWQGQVEKNKISQNDLHAYKNNLRFSSNINDCKADLVIEAIIERASAKVDLFQQLAAINPINTLFVSNTSSISINQIAAKLEDPFRFAGMHFFNPATLMQLVELVKADQTSEAMIKLLQTFVQSLGKTSVICKDSPGFIVNRVARPYYLESLRMLEQGTADLATIDQALEATGFKMGPFKLMDLIGIDINYSVSNIVWDALGKPIRLQPSPIQQQKIELQELGRKTEKGFYSYPKK
ncbi:MAG: 3-hydroxyacyl-CoA dehydrogenase NAD-binding domain-containing protein [Bacteroidetes bacterium]|nr:3-hydroxyacyl-CoA dehydrogenase NAD-binding domain-containing protein [Bacteroidota bacterium]